MSSQLTLLLRLTKCLTGVYFTRHPHLALLALSIAGSPVISATARSELSLEDNSLLCFQLRPAYPKGESWAQLFFSYYVNDCKDHVGDRAQLGTYADDTTLYKCLTPVNAVDQSHELQVAVDDVSAWGRSCRRVPRGGGGVRGV